MSVSNTGRLLDIGQATLTTAELVRDKPLWSVSADEPASDAAFEMSAMGFDVAPLTELPVARYVLREELEQGGDDPARRVARPITDADRIAEDLPLSQALELLRERSFVFVVHREHTTGIVTRADLEQPIVGLLVFDLVLSIEAALDVLLDCHGEDAWLGALSDERRNRVLELHQARLEANVDLDILRSLNLDDRLAVARKLDLHQAFGFDSKAKFEAWGKQLKDVRNALAHGDTLLSAIAEPMEALDELQRLREVATRAWAEQP